MGRIKYSVFLVFFINLVYSQNLTFIYELKFKENLRTNEYSIGKYFLDIKDGKSLFRSEKSRKSDSLVAINKFGMGGQDSYNNQFNVVKYYDKNTVYKMLESPIFRDVYILKADKLDWKIISEKKKIGEYDCQRAETSYGGRRWTAWFTDKMPLTDGPYVFNNLPGLIVSIADEDLDFSFELVGVRHNSWEKVMSFKNGREITWDDFKKLQIDHYNQPLKEARLRSIPMGKADQNGKVTRLDSSNLRNAEEEIRKRIRDNYNPLEKTYKVTY